MTPDHEQLLAEITQYIVSHGYTAISLAYADICDTETKKKLASIYSVPSTYIRTRADRIAFSHNTGICFEYDSKTNLKADDVFVELLPIVSHYAIRKWFGLKTFYGFRWPKLPREDIGFEIDDIFVDMVDAVFLFDRPCQCEVNEWVKKMAPHIFKNATVVETSRGGGSGDPAVKIHGNKLGNFPHWRDVFKAACGT